jgi:hypothetical protein
MIRMEGCHSIKTRDINVVVLVVETGEEADVIPVDAVVVVDVAVVLDVHQPIRSMTTTTMPTLRRSRK